MNTKEAIKYAELSQLAYEQDYSKVQQQLPKFNLKPLARIDDRPTDTEGFIATDEEETYIVVGFAGTESGRDFLTDASFLRDEIIDGKEGTAHGGFVKCLDNIYDAVEAVLKPYHTKIPFYITGHSLGGALASLLVYRLGTRFPEMKDHMKLFVYGCPPVGDKKYREFFAKVESHVVTCTGDYISYGWLISMMPYWKPKTEFLLQGGDHSLDTYIALLKEKL